MVLNFIICLSISLGVGCNKENPPVPILIPPTPCMYGLCDTSKLGLVWQAPLSADTAQWGSIDPVCYGDNVVFSKRMLRSGDDTLKAFALRTGNLRWEWSNYLLKGTGSSLNKTMYESKGKLFVNTWDEIYCINAENGKSVWTSEAPDRSGHPYFKMIDEDIYHIHEKNVGKAMISSTLVKHNTNTGTWLLVFKQDSVGKYEVGLETPSKWISP